MQDVGFWVGSPGAAVDQAESKWETSEYPLKLSSEKGARRNFPTEWRCYSKEPWGNTREPGYPMGEGQKCYSRALKSPTFASAGMRGHTGDGGSQGKHLQ